MKNSLIIGIMATIITSCNAQQKVVEQPALKTTKQATLQKTSTISAAPSMLINNNKSTSFNKINNELPASIITTAIDHSSFDHIIKKHVTKDGRVDYAGIKKDKALLDAYLQLIKVNAPNDSWSKNEKFAYYMNAYNAMTLDLIINNYPTESIKDLKDPWGQGNWKIGDKTVTLEEIEHKILRKMDEPRIHFGINCASFSCPPLPNQAFTAQKVQSQMEELAIQFVNDPKRNKISINAVEISKIFKWFSEDFTNDGTIIDYLNKYSTIKIDKDARVRYMDYDWNLNK